MSVDEEITKAVLEYELLEVLPKEIVSRIELRIHGCWLWLGPVRHGYAFLGRKRVYRLTYEALFGPFPVGLYPDHLCRTKSCVHPLHIEPVTHRENTLRGYGPTAINARRTHCPKGHPYSGENLILGVNRRGYPMRSCRECARAFTKRYHKAHGWQKFSKLYRDLEILEALTHA